MMEDVTRDLELNMFGVYKFDFKNHQLAHILQNISNFVMEKASKTKACPI